MGAEWFYLCCSAVHCLVAAISRPGNWRAIIALPRPGPSSANDRQRQRRPRAQETPGCRPARHTARGEGGGNSPVYLMRYEFHANGPVPCLLRLQQRAPACKSGMPDHDATLQPWSPPGMGAVTSEHGVFTTQFA